MRVPEKKTGMTLYYIISYEPKFHEMFKAQGFEFRYACTVISAISKTKCISVAIFVNSVQPQLNVIVYKVKVFLESPFDVKSEVTYEH